MGLEARAVPAAGFDIEWVSIQGLRARGAISWLLLPIRLLVAGVQSLRIMLRRRPDVVLAMGGFVAGPGGLIAWILRKPLLIHEQNAIPGLTNRWLAWIADQVLCGFPGAFHGVPAARHVGNPVRREIATLPPPQTSAQHTGPLCLLVLGGSQGARTRFPRFGTSAAGAGASPRVWLTKGCRERRASRPLSTIWRAPTAGPI
jgi:UDP-N-acetylglucosamine--N-acetylmuramyl-(pentapeptide) pyrophosphoryl-undecaprenol N-acetylglucosamine transferase